MLVKHKTEQLSFSFWAGYLLVDFFNIDFTPIDVREMSSVFQLLKRFSFGKSETPIELKANGVEIDYGNFDLAKISYADFYQIKPNDVHKSIIDFVINNYLENHSYHENEINRLTTIINEFTTRYLTDYPIILTNSAALPPLSYGGTYDFFKPYLFINISKQQYAHLEIAYD